MESALVTLTFKFSNDGLTVVTMVLSRETRKMAIESPISNVARAQALG